MPLKAVCVLNSNRVSIIKGDAVPNVSPAKGQPQPQQTQPTEPVAVKGVIHFTQQNPTADVSVSGVITGLAPGQHGFHVHEFGNFTNGCATVGGHFNPHHQEHGGLKDYIRHVGDLGNVTADDNGKANVDITPKFVTLAGPLSIIGRALLVQESADDLGKGGQEHSKTTGNTNSPVAWGVIGIAK